MWSDSWTTTGVLAKQEQLSDCQMAAKQCLDAIEKEGKKPFLHLKFIFHFFHIT